MGLPKANWLATVEDAAAHHSVPCLSTGLEHAVYARWSDKTYNGDGDDNSRAWAAEAIEHYGHAADALCIAAAAAAAACLPCVCAELAARSDEAAARAAALRAELARPSPAAHHGCGCCAGGGGPPVKEKSKRCTCGEKKKEDKAKCMCSVCVADRKGRECSCSSGSEVCGVACVTPAYACWPWYGC